MVFNLNNRELSDIVGRYAIYEDDNVRCYYTGSFYIPKLSFGHESIVQLISDYKKNKVINYLDNYGAYRVILIDKDKDEVLFFADNAGLCCFYYNPETNIISDSFLELVSNTSIITPDFEAITEFLHFSCIYSDHTICREIRRTEALCCYAVSGPNCQITCLTKGVAINDNYFPYLNMHSMMVDAVNAYKGLKMVDIITGGMDSRTVLSHLSALDAEFTLAISGKDSELDVQIAKRIADKLKKTIIVSDEIINDKDPDWVMKLFNSTDGVVGTFDYYRLYKLFNRLKESGIEIEMGGVCGELYKNGFVNQDYPVLRQGKVNKEKFYLLKVSGSLFPTQYFSDEINTIAKSMKETISNRFFTGPRSIPKNKIYFEAGTKIMRYRMITISNTKSFYLYYFAPLAEPNLYKLMYNVDPKFLQMGSFQRKEVSSYCPLIRNIKTDRGTTLNNSKIAFFKEYMSSHFFLFKIGIKRLICRGPEHTNATPESFIEGRKTREHVLSMEKCRELNILNWQVDINELSDNIADRLMTIGLTFLRL